VLAHLVVAIAVISILRRLKDFAILWTVRPEVSFSDRMWGRHSAIGYALAESLRWATDDCACAAKPTSCGPCRRFRCYGRLSGTPGLSAAAPAVWRFGI